MRLGEASLPNVECEPHDVRNRDAQGRGHWREKPLFGNAMVGFLPARDRLVVDSGSLPQLDLTHLGLLAIDLDRQTDVLALHARRGVHARDVYYGSPI